MKIKVFSKTMRFIDDEESGDWWRIHLESKEVHHHCWHTYDFDNWGDDAGRYMWVPCDWDEVFDHNDHITRVIRCVRCPEIAPDDVVAHARMLGINMPVRERPSIEDQYTEIKKQLDLIPSKPLPPWQTSDGTSWQLDYTYRPSSSTDLTLQTTSGTTVVNSSLTWKNGVMRREPNDIK